MLSFRSCKLIVLINFTCYFYLAGCGADEPGQHPALLSNPLAENIIELPITVESTAANGQSEFIHGTSGNKLFEFNAFDNTILNTEVKGARIANLLNSKGSLYIAFAYESDALTMSDFTFAQDSNGKFRVVLEPEHFDFTLKAIGKSTQPFIDDSGLLIIDGEVVVPHTPHAIADEASRLLITFSDSVARRPACISALGEKYYSGTPPALLNSSTVLQYYRLYATDEAAPNTIYQFYVGNYECDDYQTHTYDSNLGGQIFGGNQFIIARHGQIIGSRKNLRLWTQDLDMQSIIVRTDGTLVTLTGDHRLQVYDTKALPENTLVAESLPLDIDSGKLLQTSQGIFLLMNNKHLVKLTID